MYILDINFHVVVITMKFNIKTLFQSCHQLSTMCRNPSVICAVAAETKREATRVKERLWWDLFSQLLHSHQLETADGEEN